MVNPIGPLTGIEFSQGVAAASKAAKGTPSAPSEGSSATGKIAETQTEKSKEKSAQKMLDAAEEFEGLLLAQMLKTARESSSGGWLGAGAGQSMSSTMELAETQLARAMAEQGALGIGKLLAKGVRAQAAAENSSATRGVEKISTEPPAARAAAEPSIPNRPVAPKLHGVR